MRYDLLDEYSALVPSRRGIARNAAVKDSEVPAEMVKRGAIANFAGLLGMLGRLFWARRQMVSSSNRSLATK